MSLLKRFFDFLIYSNLYISIAAVAFTVESQIQLGMAPQWHPYLFLILFATLFEYNSHKFVTVFFHKHSLKEAKFEWVNRNLKLFYAIVFLSVLGFIITVCFAKPIVLITFLPLGILTVLYSFPVYKKGMRLFRLRELPFAKIFIISIVWSATCIVLPLVQSGLSVDLKVLSLLILERSLFVFAITIPFDIRDIESDKNNKLITIPGTIGEKRALRLANVALFLFMIVCAIHYSFQGNTALLIAFLLSGISTLVFLNHKSIKQMRHYHYGVLDGTMLLQGVLVIAFYYLMAA